MAKNTYLPGLLLISALCFCALPLSFGLIRKASFTSVVISREEKRNGLRNVYSAEIGVVEKTGNNDGKRVEEYLRYTGLQKGYPWCAAFVCWALGKAGIKNPQSAYCPSLFPKSHLVWKRENETVKNLLPGDVFGLYFPEKGRIAHVGFIDEVKENTLITVEGNTNEAGSSEGDGVYRKRRMVGSVCCVARWKE